jgi:protoheme IX farnesyltransferase
MTLAVARERPAVLRVALGYLELTKPRIVLLVLFTGVPALLLAGKGFPGAPRFFGTLAGIALAAASAACFNHWYDRDIDARMRRTAQRPLPAGLIAPGHALTFAFVLAAAAWVALVMFGNVLAAMIGELSIVYYVVVYTVWLKRRTPENIVIGGGAGASAPLIAWAAVTGHLSWAALLLAAIVFFWTPPHFWALSLYRRDDYLRAGIPMLPVTHGEPETRRRIVLYTLGLVPLTLLLAPLGVAGPIYWVPAALMGGWFIVGALRLQRSGAIPDAVHLFRYSILYLFALYLLLTVDAGVRLGLHRTI